MKNVMKASKILMVAGTAVLCGCSVSAGSQSSNVFTVSYYDDSAIPVLVGYAYVIKGKQANMRAVEGVTYDKLSHSGIAPSDVGKHFVFRGFEGTYEDGTPIDLSSIQSDCSVYAKFDEADYTLSYTFKNGAVSLRDSKNELIKGTVKYGDSFSFSDLFNFDELSYNTPRYGYQYEFNGFTIDSDSSKTNIIDSMLKWTSGDVLPSESWVLGTLFVSTENMDSNPGYATYFSNGSEWISLGKLSDNIKLSFLCSFEETEKDFSVSVVKNGSTIGSIPAKYAVEEISVSGDGSKLTISNSRGISYSVEGTSYTAQYIKYTEETSDRIQENYSEKKVDLSHIMGDCVISII